MKSTNYAPAIKRRGDVLSQTGDSSSALDRKVAAGLFPPPIRLSPDPTRRAVGWPSHEIDELIAARVAGLDADETRALVAELIKRRQHARALVA